MRLPLTHAASESSFTHGNDRSAVYGRYTDVLVKEGARWLFLAWTGGDDPKK